MIAQSNLAQASIYIDDTPGIRITEIRSRARKLAQETGNLGLVLIDYPLITGNGRWAAKRFQNFRQLKDFGQNWKCRWLPSISTFSFYRQRTGQKAHAVETCRSGSHRAGCGYRGLLHQDDYTTMRRKGIPNNTVEVIIEKNRSVRVVLSSWCSRKSTNFQVSPRERKDKKRWGRIYRCCQKNKSNKISRTMARRRLLNWPWKMAANGENKQGNASWSLPIPLIVEYEDPNNTFVESYTYSDILTEKSYSLFGLKDSRVSSPR